VSDIVKTSGEHRTYECGEIVLRNKEVNLNGVGDDLVTDFGKVKCELGECENGGRIDVLHKESTSSTIDLRFVRHLKGGGPKPDRHKKLLGNFAKKKSQGNQSNDSKPSQNSENESTQKPKPGPKPKAKRGPKKQEIIVDEEMAEEQENEANHFVEPQTNVPENAEITNMVVEEPVNCENESIQAENSGRSGTGRCARAA
jgi:hypothetical protein